MQPLTSRRESIFRFWRHNRINFPIHKAIRFEFPKDLDEHLFRDVGDTALHLVKPLCAAGKAIKDDGCPFVADEPKDSARRVASVEYVGKSAPGPHWLHGIEKRLCKKHH